MLRKFGDSFFWIQHVQIRLNDISEHFYQKMHSHVAFCVIYTRLYGLEKFHHYSFGRGVHIITDHKPLVAIANKPLSKAPRRLQNLLLHAQKYRFTLEWQPSTSIPVADTLSRAPAEKCD